MTMTATELRAKLYRVLDQVLQTGEPVEIVRNGQRLKIVPAGSAEPAKRLIQRLDYLRCDPDEIVHLDWSDQWKP